MDVPTDLLLIRALHAAAASCIYHPLDPASQSGESALDARERSAKAPPSDTNLTYGSRLGSLKTAATNWTFERM
jgi:hypothetical protein